MLYTRRGDDGTSGLFKTKRRLGKGSAIYEALGTVDELNSLLGVCRARAEDGGEISVRAEVLKAQEALFMIQASLAGAEKRVTKAHVAQLEQTIAHVERLISAPRAFVVPGATELSGFLDYARAVARRAERAVVRVSGRRAPPVARIYLNRLSSFLFALARYAAARDGIQELAPTYR